MPNSAQLALRASAAAPRACVVDDGEPRGKRRRRVVHRRHGAIGAAHARPRARARRTPAARSPRERGEDRRRARPGRPAPRDDVLVPDLLEERLRCRHGRPSLCERRGPVRANSDRARDAGPCPSAASIRLSALRYALALATMMSVSARCRGTRARSGPRAARSARLALRERADADASPRRARRSPR
jgi:hypothetical protein